MLGFITSLLTREVGKKVATGVVVSAASYGAVRGIKALTSDDKGSKGSKGSKKTKSIPRKVLRAKVEEILKGHSYKQLRSNAKKRGLKTGSSPTKKHLATMIAKHAYANGK